MREDALNKIAAYLDKLLIGGRPEALEESEFDGTILPLIEKLNKLGNDIVEMAEFTRGIAKGNIWMQAPDRRNYLVHALKELQSNLKHICWQADQVAKGNLNQSLDFMGDYTRAFNEMIRRVAERENYLKNKIKEVEDEKHVLTLSQSLLSNVLHNISDVVLIMRGEEELFKNAAAEQIILSASEEKQGESIVAYMQELAVTGFKGGAEEYYDKTSRRWYGIERKDFLWHDEQFTDLFVASDVTQHKRSEIRLRRDSEFDELTAIGNRKHGMRLLNEALKQKSSFPISLTFIDLDRLKRINDEFGHSAGDYYLKGFASKFKKYLGRNKTITRIGGDEFLVMMRCTDSAAAKELIVTVQNDLKKDRSECFPYPCEFSYGILEIGIDNNLSGLELIKTADSLMYKNKLTKYQS